jgi:Uma2 family endonuclease
MSTATAPPIPTKITPEPAWEIAKLFPAQGYWEVSDYLKLNGNYLIEFSHGHVEVLPMPTDAHQAMVAFLYTALLSFTKPSNLGTVRFAPLRVRLDAEKFREPDILFMLTKNDHRRHNEFWDGADLVMEIVSDDDRRRDFETKRFEYARAGVPEYWIIDPQKREITVFTLAGDRYDVHGVFASGQQATSALLPGFEVSVADVFSAK